MSLVRFVVFAGNLELLALCSLITRAFSPPRAVTFVVGEDEIVVAASSVEEAVVMIMTLGEDKAVVLDLLS